MTYPIPSGALDDRHAFVGTAGSGKTYSSGTAVERVLLAKGRVVIVDPLGVWWGLRMAPDGQTPSVFKVVIFGGTHGDLPINEHAGALIGETVAGMAESCIIDLSGIGTKAGERRFMLAFLTALYRKTHGEPVHVVFDEADMFAPQRLLDKEGEAAKLLGMMETIVRRGRVKGFIPWLITQRPAVLSKDVLSQADGLVAFKLTSSQDRDAIGGWIEGQADKATGKEMLASLPALQVGQAVVWVPGRGILATTQFPTKATFDSSRSPKRGEKLRAAALKPINLGALKDRLATVEAETKANDPKALQARIRELEKQLTFLPKVEPMKDLAAIEEAERRGFTAGRNALFAAMWGSFGKLSEDIHNSIAAFLREQADNIETPVSPPLLPGGTNAGARPVPKPSNPLPAASGNGTLSPSARAIIDVIHRSHPVSLSFDAAARRAGISKRSSAYRKYRQEVEGSAEVRLEAGRFRSLMPAGGGIDTKASVDQWIAKLPPSYGNMLRAIADIGPVDKVSIAERAGVSPTSSGLGSGLRELLDLELIEANGSEYTLAEGLL